MNCRFKWGRGRLKVCAAPFLCRRNDLAGEVDVGRAKKQDIINTFLPSLCTKLDFNLAVLVGSVDTAQAATPLSVDGRVAIRRGRRMSCLSLSKRPDQTTIGIGGGCETNGVEQ